MSDSFELFVAAAEALVQELTYVKERLQILESNVDILLGRNEDD